MQTLDLELLVMTTATRRVDFRVQNLDCEAEAARIRRGLKTTDGLLELGIQPSAAGT